ncbi:MAG: Gfo/Idh/MocA family oxidoreductase [Oscillospiraceae bacterium]|nr:Gfo/Idh/MocA family oxidoreductase [Oscillospiraceae bacterium]
MIFLIKYATIGTSWITKSFIEGCNLTDGFELKAVYSRTVEKGREFAKDFGCNRIITDINELAKDSGIDAVYIASPNIFHYEQSRLMLENGKHVICEKPAVTKSEELTQLIQLAKDNNLIFMEAIMERYLPARAMLLHAIDQLGDITTATFDFCQYSSKYPAFEKGETPNIFNPKMAGGALMDLGIYCIYAAVDYFGLPDSVSASADFLRTGADGSGCATLKYPEKTVNLIYSKTEQAETGSEIIGSNGRIQIDSISKLTDIDVVLNGEKTNLIGDVPKAELMSFEARAFAEFINNFSSMNEQYKNVTELTISVHKLMDEIKKICNIKFS